MSGGFNRKWKLGKQMNSSFMKHYPSIAEAGKNISHHREACHSIASKSKKHVCEGVDLLGRDLSYESTFKMYDLDGISFS